MREVAGAEHLDDIFGAHRHIGELTVLVADDIDMVGDRSGVDRPEHAEGRLRVEYHRLAHVLQRQPDLLAVRSRCDIGAERASLLNATDDLFRRGVDHNRPGEKLEQT